MKACYSYYSNKIVTCFECNHNINMWYPGFTDLYCTVVIVKSPVNNINLVEKKNIEYFIIDNVDVNCGYTHWICEYICKKKEIVFHE